MRGPVVWLASDASTYVTGSDVFVDAGKSLLHPVLSKLEKWRLNGWLTLTYLQATTLGKLPDYRKTAKQDQHINVSYGKL